MQPDVVGPRPYSECRPEAWFVGRLGSGSRAWRRPAASAATRPRPQCAPRLLPPERALGIARASFADRRERPHRRPRARVVRPAAPKACPSRRWRGSTLAASIAAWSVTAPSPRTSLRPWHRSARGRFPRRRSAEGSGIHEGPARAHHGRLTRPTMQTRSWRWRRMRDGLGLRASKARTDRLRRGSS